MTYNPLAQVRKQRVAWTCREAKIHDALLFFDECEAIFEDREKHGSNHVNMLLTEVEKHEGIIIMATNRCYSSTAFCTFDVVMVVPL